MNRQLFQPVYELLGISQGPTAYYILAIIAFLSAIPMSLYLMPKFKLKRSHGIIIALAVYPSALFFSKLFHMLFDGRLSFYLEKLDQLGLIEFMTRYGHPLKGGQVFYGGVFGGVLASMITMLILYRKHDLKNRILKTCDVAAFCVILGSGIGRVGCFFEGCCYGMPHKTFGIVFPKGSNTAFSLASKKLLKNPFVETMPLIPTQLLHSIGSFSIFIFLMFQLKKVDKKNPGYYVFVTLIAHASIRFILEFLRFDSRGGFLYLSTSQWIALFIVTALFTPRIVKKLRK